jgi:hypothetical protein
VRLAALLDADRRGLTSLLEVAGFAAGKTDPFSLADRGIRAFSGDVS